MRLSRAKPVVVLGACALVGTASASRAEVLMSEAAALRAACPGVTPQRKILYLTPEQVGAVEAAARSRLPSPIVTSFECRDGGSVTARAVLDTSVVRTMPETVLSVVEPDGRLRMALVLQFGEPPDYLPRPGWLDTLAGKSLDDGLAPGRDVRRVTGATLTVAALTAAVRRALAIDRILLRGRS
jgi:hypothetical protein